MMKTKIITAIIAIGMFAGLISPLVLSNTVSAAGGCNNSSTFLGFPTWYRGVATGSNCTVEFKGSSDDLGSFIWKIVLNIIEIAIRIVAFIATGYILYGGFTYLTANGSPDKAAKGLNLIMSAVIGLVISIASIAIVNTLFTIVPSGGASGIPEATAADVISGITKIVYWIAGAVAVIMLIISGIRFITSAGNPSGIQKARSSIMHSVVGLIVIILAFTITQIVLGYFK